MKNKKQDEDTLSSKKLNPYSNNPYKAYIRVDDVKEFIRKRKKKINIRYANEELTMIQRNFLFDDLDADAGEELTRSQ